MRIAMLIIGIILIAAAAVCLAFGVVYYLGYKSLIDGTAGMYARALCRAKTFLISGGAAAVAGTVCLILRIKLHQ